jgi:sugar phosphate isomerase/epimerase
LQLHMLRMRGSFKCLQHCESRRRRLQPRSHKSPSPSLPESQLSPDIVQHIRDLRELAIIGTTFNPPIGVMYEALSWSYLVNTWQKADAVVRQVDMPNFWLCHDIFHVASLLYADYFDATGVQRCLPGWRESLKELALSDSSKVFVCQLTDSYRLNPKFPENPLWESDEAHHYLTVSKCCRPLPGKGYFPCKEFIDALLETGYDGWFSVETFVPDYSERGQGVPRRLAQEAWDCMNEFVPYK